MPNKFHGLVDVEARYRNRHLDLMTNEDSRNTFIIRSQIIAGIRKFMLGERFMEVETPMMHPIPGERWLVHLKRTIMPSTCRYTFALLQSYTSND